MDECNKTMVFSHGNLLFVFNWHPTASIPDFWIKELKEVPDEDWNIWELWDVMTNRLPEVKTVAYAESHDQALVGDKTLAFWLMDK